jgi:hypothetical protein
MEEEEEEYYDEDEEYGSIIPQALPVDEGWTDEELERRIAGTLSC